MSHSTSNWRRLQDRENTKKKIDRMYEGVDAREAYDDYYQYTKPVYHWRGRKEMGDGVPEVAVMYDPIAGNNDKFRDGSDSTDDQYFVAFKPDTTENWMRESTCSTQSKCKDRAQEFMSEYAGREVHKDQDLDKVYKYKADFVDTPLSEYKDPDTGDTHFNFGGMPPSVARDLMTGHPNIEPTGKQNYSPQAKEMVRLAEKHDGVLTGYAITPPRHDMRISLTGMYLDVGDKEAKNLRVELNPDSFEQLEDGRYRFWWD